jgi:tRNA G10  N-methylase Trm11
MSDSLSLKAKASLHEMFVQYDSEKKPIEVDFRQLAQWVRSGDQLTHHIHPYPAKLLPHIANFFLKAFDDIPKKIVLDPFCGSGTVALEGSIAGYTTLVADANPFALLITKVKTTAYLTDKLESTLANIQKKYYNYQSAPSIPVVNHSLWYTVKHKSILDCLYCVITNEVPETQLEFFLLCFSLAAKKLSFADPAISVPVRLKPKDRFSEHTNHKIISKLDWIKNEACAFQEFEKIVEINIQRIKNTNYLFPDREPAKLVGIDAKNLHLNHDCSNGIESNSVPLIITSPPYGSAQKYVRSTSLSLNWLKLASPKELRELEEKSIGREHLKTKSFDIELSSLPNDFKNVLKLIGQVNQKRALITFKYLEEMDQAIKELSRVLSIGGHIVFVIGNNQVCGQVLRNDEYIISCFKKYGVNLKLFLLDDIKSRGLMTKRNRTASVISREAVLVFHKEV